ncbi:unnamed protein product [Heligmosomoides polygyrus]|uniref:Coatomer subunit epsilon n=1 Tax=Heligmosomoides polygyrus TaxID=6339 RepID=A0A183FKI1_HELPZ|nr:unnamed protein product [Heligmosomoides polygyrus]
MTDKYGQRPRLLIAQSAVLTLQETTDGEALLHNAQLRDSNNCDALVNLVAVSQFVGKDCEVIKRTITQLQDIDSSHPWLADMKARRAFW